MSGGSEVCPHRRALAGGPIPAAPAWGNLSQSNMSEKALKVLRGGTLKGVHAGVFFGPLHLRCPVSSDRRVSELRLPHRRGVSFARLGREKKTIKETNIHIYMYNEILN